MINDIVTALESYADPARQKFAATSYPTKTRVIGVTNPPLKEVLKEVRSQTQNYSVGEKIELSKILVQSSIFECQQLAYEFIGRDKKCLNQLTEKDIDQLGINLDNWVAVDYYAALIVGVAWREQIINTQKIKKYLQSDDVWIRRVGVVATVALNQKARGGHGDPIQTLEICKLVVDDHADMINKALSWALRELAKRDKTPVEAFICQYKDRLHKRVLHEVTHKLEKGTKN